MQQLPAHSVYLVQESKETADAVAYAFLSNTGEPVQYPYKYPKIADDDVRIRILFTGLCHSDCLHSRGLWDPYIKYPSCPGHEVVGEVEKVGTGVTKFKVGDKVGCNPQRWMCQTCELCKKGDNQLCSQNIGLYDDNNFGGYSTHIQVAERMVFRIPDGFNDALGSPLLCAGVTVFAPLKRYYKPNYSCAVIGIGGLGHLAVQYAAKLGMTVTAFTTSKNREQEIKKLGASNLSSSIDVESLKAEQGKYDIVINTLYIENEEVFKSHQRLTAPTGTYIQVGAPPSKVNFKLDHAYIILNQIRVAGSLIGNYDETQEMLEFSAQNNVYPIVETFEFEEFPKAFDRMEKAQAKFRCVVNVGKWAQANGLWK
ncbi:unnamed protein product [Paramecium pentaurelia]|uniref:Enoyl reductase (ER) domain-containing protein n=1 Tax=Paramecium pentaurelia TaxID=43138 RepID=A0A8S1U198_9CILI|nr:unnamed protein product [Paramecium pentaurelia]